MGKLGFEVEAAKVKSQRASLDDLIVYVKQESDSLVLVIDPVFEDRLDKLRAIPGVRRPTPAGEYVHNQSFRSFPARLHTGATERPYGLDFDFDTPEALAAFVEALRRPAITAPTSGPIPAPKVGDPRTETESVRAARLGQTRFRNALMDRWSRRCAVTGLPLPELLRASHIKPWRDSTPAERLDPHNGLLLAVHVDGLFDRGLVTFEDDGRLIASSALDEAVRTQLGLNGLQINGLSTENRRYLVLHRSVYFQGPPATSSTK
ncbi:HNH endonuclease [Methylobacterium tarhaniae]|uniref:HNH endonuclease n=1 Tax=Methylobacterium tarhaniae TaxID=1187852 RepID=UPI003CFC602A